MFAMKYAAWSAQRDGLIGREAKCVNTADSMICCFGRNEMSFSQVSYSKKIQHLAHLYKRDDPTIDTPQKSPQQRNGHSGKQNNPTPASVSNNSMSGK